MSTVTADPSHEADRALPRTLVSVGTPGEYLLALRSLRAKSRALREQRGQAPGPLSFTEPSPRTL